MRTWSPLARAAVSPRWVGREKEEERGDIDSGVSGVECGYHEMVFYFLFSHFSCFPSPSSPLFYVFALSFSFYLDSSVFSSLPPLSLSLTSFFPRSFVCVVHFFYLIGKMLPKRHQDAARGASQGPDCKDAWNYRLSGWRSYGRQGYEGEKEKREREGEGMRREERKGRDKGKREEGENDEVKDSGGSWIISVA